MMDLGGNTANGRRMLAFGNGIAHPEGELATAARSARGLPVSSLQNIQIIGGPERIRVATHVFTQPTERNAFLDAADRGLRGWPVIFACLRGSLCVRFISE